MGKNTQPLVSVVTPVHNGEEYLVECIESVLAQTYQNWEYVIVDNCSTDRTLEISRVYQRRDGRIRVDENPEFLPLISNWNRAIRQISTDSKYCKVLHADDQLFPDCLTRMVEVAEVKPSVGLVGAYRLSGDSVLPHEPTYLTTVSSGHEVCRSLLLGGPDVFGSPTSLLIVSHMIENRERFYNESNLHADTEACYEVLKTSDFGFVHEVLTYTRLHNGSVTQKHDALGTYILAHFLNLRKYGPVYLGEEEYHDRLTRQTVRYYRFLCKQSLKGGLDVLRYHKRGLGESGLSLSASHMAKGFAWLFVRRLINGARTLKSIAKDLSRRCPT